MARHPRKKKQKPITHCPTCGIKLPTDGQIDMWCPDCGTDLSKPKFEQNPEPAPFSIPARGPKRKRPIHIITKAEVVAMLKACGDSNVGIRDQALIAMFYWAGLRIQEAIDMMPYDVRERRWIEVVSGKGGVRRVCRICKDGEPYVKRWLKKRVALSIPLTVVFFCTLTKAHNPLRQGNTRNLMSRLRLECEINKRVNPHGLRHSHAFMLSELGIPLRDISLQLGHKSSATTSIYLDHLTGGDLDKIANLDWD